MDESSEDVPDETLRGEALTPEAGSMLSGLVRKMSKKIDAGRSMQLSADELQLFAAIGGFRQLSLAAEREQRARACVRFRSIVAPEQPDRGFDE